jgi:siroheme synthase-like protein
MSPGYPVVLNLHGKRVLIIGMGREADEKSAALAACGAEITRQESRFEPGDCAGYFLVVSAGPWREDNPAIFEEAERLGILVNCVDDPPRCRFTFASIVRQGDLLLALSTQGACPALSVRLRERLQRELGPEYAEFLEMARSKRESMAKRIPDFRRRRETWYRLVDSEIICLLGEGRQEEAERRWESILEESQCA